MFGFDNVSDKIKAIAKILNFIGIASSIIGGISFAISEEFWDFGVIYLFIGVAIAVIGSFSFRISSLFLYGFGELIEKVSDISKKDSKNL